MTDLLSVSDAQQRLLDRFQPTKGTSIPISSAKGRVIHEDILATTDLPSFDNSSMDGYAVLARDLLAATEAQPVRLTIVEEIPAGYVPQIELFSGQASRIMTGAMLPAGADCVIPVEDTTLPESLESQHVLILKTVRPGENVRPKGQDVRRGSKILAKGKRLQPQDIGLLASLGFSRLAVFRRPRIGLLSTGSEIVPLGSPLSPGKIHDSNAYMLASLIEKQGGLPVRLGIASDTLPAIKALLDRAAELRLDLLLSSAGVSVGKYDFIRTLMEQEGQIDFWRVNMRPGKPFTFGHYQGVPVIGLPGNPASAFVGFAVFVRPILNLLAGVGFQEQLSLSAVLTEPITSDGRESYLRGRLEQRDGHLLAAPVGHQGSGNLVSLAQSNALLIVPSGVKSLPIGTEVKVILMGGFE